MNRQQVEAIEPGCFDISLESASIEWSNNDTMLRLRQAVDDVLGEIDQDAPGCRLLRLVVIAGNFADSYHKWKHEIEWQPVLPPRRREYPCKAFFWGNGQDTTTYAVLVLPEFTVDGLLSNHYLSKWFVAAELAYTHDQAQMRKHIGSPAPITSLDWDRITPYYACSMWTDFFAQRVAYRYRPTGWLERRDLWIRSAVESRLIHYLAMFYPPRYWPRYEGFQDVIDVLAIYRDAFTNIGWHLGVLAAAAEDGYDGLHTDYYAALEETAPGWGLPARQFAEELDIVAHTAWASSRFDQLARIIERTLRTHHVIA